MPEFSLPLNLHLHHYVISVLDALQGFFNSWKQVNDFLFADQDLTVERKVKNITSEKQKTKCRGDAEMTLT